MNLNHKKLGVSTILLLGLPLALGSSVYAAEAVDLNHVSPHIMQSFVPAKNNNGMSVKKLTSRVDFKNTLHVRVQEMYNGYPVWGADGIVHIPNSGKSSSHMGLSTLAATSGATMNGIFYDNLNADLSSTPSSVFTEVQARKALQQAINAYQNKVGGKPNVTKQKSSLMVYIDENNKAYWAYKVSFDASPVRAQQIPAQPIYILDAVSFNIFEQWDDIKTIDNDDAFGGGFGGNQKMGQLVYDGLVDHLDKLHIKRDGTMGTCFLQNSDVKVERCTASDRGQCKHSEDFTVSCATLDPTHNNVYWNGDMDAVNGGYSPSNDALFNGAIIKDLYKKWYNVPVLVEEDGVTPMLLKMIVHLPIDNAYWDGAAMNFGDGKIIFYPLTSLGVAAHEVSHGFTQQHSNLSYSKQAGGMNESYSDMAAQAAEYFAYGKNSWEIGPEIFKQDGKALRYMDKPSKDCNGAKPGPGVRCSLDDASQYKDGIDVHFTSGVYNRLFYTLATTEGWGVRKAFNVMVQANANYWTSSATFSTAACGVISAATDLGFEVDAVKAAFDVVKVNYSKC